MDTAAKAVSSCVILGFRYSMLVALFGSALITAQPKV